MDMNTKTDPSTIDEYLDRLEYNCRFMPRKDRTIVRHEVGLHLETLVAFIEETGKTRSDAVRGAIKQFGDPASIGLEISREADRAYWTVSRKLKLSFALLLMIGSWWLAGSDIRAVIASSWMLPLIIGSLNGASLALRSAFLQKKLGIKSMTVTDLEQLLLDRRRLEVIGGADEYRILMIDHIRSQRLERYSRERQFPLSRLNAGFFCRIAVCLVLIVLLLTSAFRIAALFIWSSYSVSVIVNAFAKHRMRMAETAE